MILGREQLATLVTSIDRVLTTLMASHREHRSRIEVLSIQLQKPALKEQVKNVSRPSATDGKGDKHKVWSLSRDKRTRGLVVDEELEHSSSFGGLSREHRSIFDDLDR